MNRLGTFGRWDFVELTEVWEIESGFEKKVEQAVARMVDSKAGAAA